jgi:C-terminal processing protease CtpA/Prc
VDTTDWDLVYSKYHPLFEVMGNEPYSVWVKTWKELTYSLLDHHLVIRIKRSSTDSSLTLKPGLDEVRKREYYHDADPNRDMEWLNILSGCNRLVDTVSTVIKDSSWIPPTTRLFYSGIIDQEIAYFHIPSFSELSLDTIMAFEHFKYLVANENIKACVIDVRDNNGGNSANLKSLLSCFTNEPVLIGYSRTKLGIGRDDLSMKIPAVVEPSINSQKREMPIVILANIFSQSMAEVTVIALRHLPQCYMIGERTYGATGGSADYLVDKEGNGFSIRTAQLFFEDVDGTVYEGHGVEPDVECLFDQSAWNNGVDNQLECAVGFLKTKIN